MWFILRETVKGGGKETSLCEETSELVAVLQGFNSASLLSLSHLSSYSRCQNIWAYLFWGADYGLVVRSCVCSAPQEVSANSKHSLGSKRSVGVTGAGCEVGKPQLSPVLPGAAGSAVVGAGGSQVQWQGAGETRGIFPSCVISCRSHHDIPPLDQAQDSCF